MPVVIIYGYQLSILSPAHGIETGFMPFYSYLPNNRYLYYIITSTHIAADELSLSILNSIREAYKGREINIFISDEEHVPDRKQELLKRFENIRHDKNKVTFTGSDFFKTYKKKIAAAAYKI